MEDCICRNVVTRSKGTGHGTLEVEVGKNSLELRLLTGSPKEPQEVGLGPATAGLS